MTKASRQESTAHAPGEPASLTRRALLVKGAAGAAGALLMLGSPRLFAAARDREIRIGWISPRSGVLAALVNQDPYILAMARQALAKGLRIGNETYKVTIIERDSQSSASRAGELANELITKEHVHLMLSQMTPLTVNPVSDACEAAGVPSIGTALPLESFFFGRGGKVGQPSPFKWSFAFFPDAELWVKCYLSTWSQLPTNKKIGVLYPNDADGNSFRGHFGPIFEKHGYTVVDPGPYQDGTTDYATQIALFNRENCQIFNTVGLPDDVSAFWRQAAQQRYTRKVRIATFAKSGQVPEQITPLGALGYKLTTAIFWTPVFPYKSPLNGMTSRQLAEGYEKSVHQLWTTNVGISMALAELGVAALKTARDPTDRSAIRTALSTLDMTTIVGPVDFRKGPYPNTATSPIIGVQWVKPSAGSRFQLDCVTIEHVNDTAIPIQRKLASYSA